MTNAKLWKVLIFIVYVIRVWVWEPRDWGEDRAVPGLIVSCKVSQEKKNTSLKRETKCQFPCLWSNSKGKNQWEIIVHSLRLWPGNSLSYRKISGSANDLGLFPNKFWIARGENGELIGPCPKPEVPVDNAQQWNNYYFCLAERVWQVSALEEGPEGVDHLPSLHYFQLCFHLYDFAE